MVIRHRVDPEQFIVKADLSQNHNYTNFKTKNFKKQGCQTVTLREIHYTNVFRPIKSSNNTCDYKFVDTTGTTRTITASLPLKASLNEQDFRFYGGHEEIKAELSAIQRAYQLYAPVTDFAMEFIIPGDGFTLVAAFTIYTANATEPANIALHIPDPATYPSTLWKYLNVEFITGEDTLASNYIVMKKVTGSTRYSWSYKTVSPTRYCHTIEIIIANIPAQPNYYYLHSEYFARRNVNTGHASANYIMKIPVPQHGTYGDRYIFKPDKAFDVDPATFSDIDFRMTDGNDDPVIVYDPRMKMTIAFDIHETTDNVITTNK
jgi:hypothetical protein